MKIQEMVKIEKVKLYPYNWFEYLYLDSNKLYERYINWVIGEFDLYIKEESEELKVYFPNGWFVIRLLNERVNDCIVEIKVSCKSKICREKITQKLNGIYRHVKQFQELKKKTK